MWLWFIGKVFFTLFAVVFLNQSLSGVADTGFYRVFDYVAMRALH